jgi:hypothetical protein
MIITGEFPLQENSFFVEGAKYLIRERKQARGKKPQYYLVKLEPFQYVSSLFPTGEEESYTFDYEQKLYRLERKEHSVTLKFL